MIFKLRRTSRWSYERSDFKYLKHEGFKIVETITGQDHAKRYDYTVEIDSLDHLLKLLNCAGHDLVLSDGLIEIYDDYRE